MMAPLQMADSMASQPALQRARGAARLRLVERDGVTRLNRLFQEGSAKVRLSTEAPDREAVLINTAGGIAQGDRFAWSVALNNGARCTVLTQACEKVYRSPDDLASAEAARVEVTLEVGAHARLDWLPQETILFDCARLNRTLEIDLAPSAELLAVEAVILGRRAMGETVTALGLRDRWRVRRAGRLIFADDLKLQGPLASLTERRALMDSAGAYASVLLAADDAEGALGAVRALLPPGAGASAFDGKLFCRILAADGLALRRALIPVLTTLRGGRALPRLWTV